MSPALTCPLEGCQISRTHSHGTDATYAPALPAAPAGGDRCPYVSTDPIVTSRPRDDGWRCGETAGTPHGHTLYDADGERTLYSASWALPDPVPGVDPSRPRVIGYCPMGCGQTLILSEDGHVTCWWRDCPTPKAVDRLLEDPHIEAHIVEVHDASTGSISMQHPLHERLNGVLLDNCPLDAHLRSRGGIPVTSEGRYTVSRSTGQWRWMSE